MTDSESVPRPGRSSPTIGRLLSASEAARVTIQQMIESGEFGPGQRIDPDALGDLLGVSRTPVRDALQRLKAEGLVEIRPRKGVFVREVQPHEVDEVYEIKAAVEPIAAAYAAERGSTEDKQGLLELLENLRGVASTGSVRETADVVDEIHDLIFQMADSSVLEDAYNVFHARIRLLRHLNMAQPGRLSSTLRHHSEIVELVVAGDKARARAVMADHLHDAAASARRAVS